MTNSTESLTGHEAPEPHILRAIPGDKVVHFFGINPVYPDTVVLYPEGMHSVIEKDRPAGVATGNTINESLEERQ